MSDYLEDKESGKEKIEEEQRRGKMKHTKKNRGKVPKRKEKK